MARKRKERTEEKKQAARIQTSILNAYEKKVLVWLAERMPAWVTSDMLTFVGFLGSLVMFTGYCLANLNIYWMWLSCLGLFINWFGDSLDGSLARVRNTQRKTYGFFVDHTIDVINEVIMFVGVGVSPMINLTFAMSGLIGYLMLSIYVYINCHLKGEMRLTYGGFGPTELRIIMALINIAYMYIPWLDAFKQHIVIFNNEFMVGVFDYIAMAISTILVAFYIIFFFRDARYYAKIDPLPKSSKE